jgi:ATP phosphoribosyltransferase
MPESTTAPDLLHLAIPKGRIETGVSSLLADAGIRLRSGPR